MGAGEYDLVCSVKDTLGFISSTAECGGPDLHFQRWEVETVGPEVQVHPMYTA